jgi:SpoVK/Ycf46/Vps4 family AAA+-type ATPase
MLVRALAHESGVNFVSIKGPEVSIPVVPLPPHT